METDNQKENSAKPWLWKKGQSGNIMGRPKGKTMKEYAKEYLERMTDDERDEWLEGINKDKVWEMAEGKARQDTDITSNGKTIVIPQEIYNKNAPNTSTEQNS